MKEKPELMKIFEMITDNHDIGKLLDTATAESTLSTAEEILQVQLEKLRELKKKETVALTPKKSHETPKPSGHGIVHPTCTSSVLMQQHDVRSAFALCAEPRK